MFNKLVVNLKHVNHLLCGLKLWIVMLKFQNKFNLERKKLHNLVLNYKLKINNLK
jgi:hypothetical protein